MNDNFHPTDYQPCESSLKFERESLSLCARIKWYGLLMSHHPHSTLCVLCGLACVCLVLGNVGTICWQYKLCGRVGPRAELAHISSDILPCSSL